MENISKNSKIRNSKFKPALFPILNQFTINANTFLGSLSLDKNTYKTINENTKMPHNISQNGCHYPWYVLIVKNNHQKKIAEQLEQRGIETFCPMRKEVRQWSDRKKIVEVPLLLNYIFVRLPEEERHRVFSISGVIKYLFWLGKPAFARAIEIDTLRKWLKDENIIAVEAQSIEPGKVIKIEKGPFKDKIVTVHANRRNELKLVLENLGMVIIAKTKKVA